MLVLNPQLNLQHLQDQQTFSLFLVLPVIAEFNDNHLIIKDFNTRKDFYEFCQCKIDLWKENYNILDPKVGDLIENSFV